MPLKRGILHYLKRFRHHHFIWAARLSAMKPAIAEEVQL